MNRRLIAMLLCGVFCFLGCTRVIVNKNPGDRDKGIRFYRPKPYLLIVPDGGGAASTATLSSTTTTKQNSPLELKMLSESSEGVEFRVADYQDSQDLPVPQPSGLPTPGPGADKKAQEPQTARKVSLSLHYLPDFAEEYSIRLMPGLGVGELNIKLDNGWNLTSLGMKTDQQTDEIIKATSDLVASAGNLFGERGGSSIYAMNIPFGFYEAVIATDPCGRKQLYGWRYIGFMPFQTCPVQPCGMQTVHCTDPTAIYGLAMNNDGVMHFQQLGTLAGLVEISDH